MSFEKELEARGDVRTCVPSARGWWSLTEEHMLDSEFSVLSFRKRWLQMLLTNEHNLRRRPVSKMRRESQTGKLQRVREASCVSDLKTAGAL